MNFIGKFEKWIIHKNEQEKLINYQYLVKKENWKVRFEFKLSFSLIIVLFGICLIFLIAFKSQAQILEQVFSNAFCVIFFLILFYENSIFFKLLFYDFLLKMPVGDRKKRIEEVDSFLEENMPKRNNNQTITKDGMVFDYEAFIKDPKLFVSTHFNSNQSFIRFYLEKAFDEGSVNVLFINSSLMIPKRKEINSESLKKILISIYSSEASADSSKFSEKYVNDLFSNYSESQIETLFCKKFKREDFSYFFSNVEKFDYDKSQIHDSFTSICKSIKQKAMPNFLKEFDFKIEGLSYKMLLTKQDYELASCDFSNCVRYYFDRVGSYIISYYKEKKPVAIIEVNEKGEILEINGYKNKPVDKVYYFKIIELFKKLRNS